MKNREKYRDEIVEAIKEDNVNNEKMCCFVKDNVIPRFVSEEDMELSVCVDMNCHTCAKIFALWLDEEYEEPPKPEVDWSKVPVDTLVRVRNSEDDKWLLRYFHLYCEDAVALKYNRKYKTFDRGATSKTCMYPDESWQYCELVEDEDDGSN